MSIITIRNLSKKYTSGTHALDDITLAINHGEIFALLGPNGAGKTTLISIITGLVNKTSGTILVDGKDIEKDYRLVRSMIGLVPQEIQLDIFITVQRALEYQRGFYGKPKDRKLIERILKSLNLYDKRNTQCRELSGGMKRRVMIGKALTNEPKILFLDEPTAGVDVELRKSMWEEVQRLKESGTTIILTTHYLEEAELMADRIGIINGGKLILVEEKKTLMNKLGDKKLTITLKKPLEKIPQSLESYKLIQSEDKKILTYTYQDTHSPIRELLKDFLKEEELEIIDIHTSSKSLEEIFLKLTQ